MSIKDIIFEAIRDPEARRIMAEVARQMLAQRKRARDVHWGLDDGEAELVEVPDVRDDDPELVCLGAMPAIAYVTRKRGDPDEGSTYLHEFKNPFPWLYADGDDLIVVRKRSKYRISSHGIIG